jgi:peptide/nickel transport system permease protein
MTAPPQIIVNVASGAPEPAAEGGMRQQLLTLVVRLFRDKPLGAAGGVICLVFLVCGLFAGVLAQHGINEIAPLHRLKPPSWQFPFGTDNLGRDVFTRCLYGARLSVIVAVSGAGVATLISCLIGVITGYTGGRADMLMQRFVDAWMSFPDLVILIVVVSVFGPGMMTIILTLGLLFGIGGSRVVRSAVVGVREQTYVHAAQSIGASTARILWRHIVPNILPPVIVLFTTRLGGVILAESALAFLGLGVPPPAPTWGGMLSGAGRMYMFQQPWLALAPGLCITLVVYSTNVFGDALRDLLDPRMRGSR